MMTTNPWQLHYLRLQDYLRLKVLEAENQKNDFSWLQISVYYKIINDMNQVKTDIAAESLSEAGYF